MSDDKILDALELLKTELITGVNDLKTDITELKTEVAGLKTHTAELKTDVDGLTKELKTDVTNLIPTNPRCNDIIETDQKEGLERRTYIA